jgi:hypothetical protein
LVDRLELAELIVPGNDPVVPREVDWKGIPSTRNSGLLADLLRLFRPRMVVTCAAPGKPFVWDISRSFHPDLLSTMENALDSAVAKLPHPVRSAHVTTIAESILRSASEGDRDVRALETLALLELQLNPRDA